MKSSRYDLHVKVPGRSKPFYVVRRRTIDGGFECSCPRWVEAREECRHVRPVREAMASVPRIDPIAAIIRHEVTTYPLLIGCEERLIDRLVRAIRAAL